MDRQEIIKKTMTRLGMLGDPKDPVKDDKKKELLKRFRNEKNPNKIYDYLNSLFEKDSLSQQAVHDLFVYFKKMGLFKRLLNFNIRGMEAMWRQVIKENHMVGFLLEN